MNFVNNLIRCEGKFMIPKGEKELVLRFNHDISDSLEDYDEMFEYFLNTLTTSMIEFYPILQPPQMKDRTGCDDLITMFRCFCLLL